MKLIKIVLWLFILIPKDSIAFTFYQSVGYQKPYGMKTPLDEYEFEELPIVYEKSLWEKGKVKNELDHKTLDSYISNYRPEEELVCLDVEHYKMKNESGLKEGIERLSFIAKSFKDAHPDTRIGYYSTVPERAYWEFIKGGESLKELKIKNRKLSKIAEFVDVIFPSLYVFYHDIEKWKIYATGMIREAKQYGKPVIVFLSPQMHPSNKLFAWDFVNGEFWKAQLELVYQEADGAVIWSPKRNPERWDDEWEWWIETELFLEKINYKKSKPRNPSISEVKLDN